jgi:hypothetical protein
MGAERIEAETEVSDESRLSEEAGAVRSSTLALASYWLGATRQYSTHSSSKLPNTEAIGNLSAATQHNLPELAQRRCRVMPANF